MLLISLLLLPSFVAAQPRTNLKFTPVEQGFGDVSPSAATQRLMPLDLRVPSGFDAVYKVTDGRIETAAAAGKPAWFARINGGLIATFRQSEYVETKEGIAANIPAGTEFWIGGLPRRFLDPAAVEKPALPNAINRAAAATPVDRSARRPATAEAPLAPPASNAAPPREPPTIWNDEAYRRRRLDALMDAAARLR